MFVVVTTTVLAAAATGLNNTTDSRLTSLPTTFAAHVILTVYHADLPLASQNEHISKPPSQTAAGFAVRLDR